MNKPSLMNHKELKRLIRTGNLKIAFLVNTLLIQKDSVLVLNKRDLFYIYLLSPNPLFSVSRLTFVAGRMQTGKLGEHTLPGCVAPGNSLTYSRHIYTHATRPHTHNTPLSSSSSTFFYFFDNAISSKLSNIFHLQ